MNNTEHQSTTDQAKAALESLALANNITVNSMRPPLWLILLCSVAFGIKTAAMGVMMNNNLWHSIQWAAYIICCLCVVSWIIALRAKGIRIKIADVNITKPGVIAGLLMCTLLLLARILYLQTASMLLPFIAGLLNALVLAYSLHFGLRCHAKKAEK